MKKVLLFAVLLLTSCVRVGYIADLEVHKIDGVVDTISYTYSRTTSTNALVGPDLVVDNNLLRTEDGYPIMSQVNYFSVLSVRELTTR